MSQSLANIVVHLVFSTKHRRPLLRDEERGQLHAYITGILKNHDSPLIEINSVPDHIHILFAQSKSHAPAKLVEQIKTASSGWIKTLAPCYHDFAWQTGYGEFSVSPTHVESVATRPRLQGGRPWPDRLVHRPPLSWWVRDPVARASFLLTAAYLTRDRELKLRVYPGLAPILIIPFIFLLQSHHKHGGDASGFGVPFSGIYLGMVPLFALQILQYSQQWQASDVFRAAPLPGPAALCHGARSAVLCLLAAPLLLLVGLMVFLLRGHLSELILFLPGIIALPVFALIPALCGYGLPLSQPPDEAKSANRALNMVGVMVVAFALSAVTSVARSHGWFWWLLLVETVIAVALRLLIRQRLANLPWPALE